MMKGIHSNGTFVIIALVLAVLLAANATMGFVLTGQSSAAMKVLLQTRMLDVSNTAADMLDGDKLKALKAEDKGTPDYQRVNDTLKYFQDNVDLEYIYCIQPLGDKKFVFSVDPTIEDPGEFGAPIVYTDALYRASLGTAAVDEEPYYDAWGSFYSAYSPVFGSDGQVAGIVAVDFSAKWYDEEIARQTHTIYICMGISVSVCVILVLIATSRLRRRLRDMTKDLDELAHDVDEITWEMADIRTHGGLQESMPVEEDNLGSLNERLKAVKAGLHRYWKNVSSKANSILTILSSDYRSVHYLNLDTDEGTCYKSVGQDCGWVPGQGFPFTETMETYARLFVVKEDREEFLEFMRPESIRRALKENGLITHLYMVRRDELEFYEMVRIAGLKDVENRGGYRVHSVGVGFTDLDEEASKALAHIRKSAR